MEPGVRCDSRPVQQQSPEPHGTSTSLADVLAAPHDSPVLLDADVRIRRRRVRGRSRDRLARRARQTRLWRGSWLDDVPRPTGLADRVRLRSVSPDVFCCSVRRHRPVVRWRATYRGSGRRHAARIAPHPLVAIHPWRAAYLGRKLRVCQPGTEVRSDERRQRTPHGRADRPGLRFRAHVRVFHQSRRRR